MTIASPTARSKLQIPQSPMRPHFVKARVKVHVYADGSHAVFHAPRCIGRYDENGTIRNAKTPPKSARPRGRTKAEEADIQCATKTGQLNSLSTGRPPAPPRSADAQGEDSLPRRPGRGHRPDRTIRQDFSGRRAAAKLGPHPARSRPRDPIAASR
jgi:hypothetical protein